MDGLIVGVSGLMAAIVGFYKIADKKKIGDTALEGKANGDMYE
jgi:hypothetical protein